MSEIEISLGGKTCVLPSLETHATAPGGFAFGVYKAGSTLLNSIIVRASKTCGMPALNIVGHFRANGIVIEREDFDASAQQSLDTYLQQPGAVYSGWREFPANYTLPLTPQTRTYLLVRDPRDMLTSQFFSLKYSHTTAGPAGAQIQKARQKIQETDIDTFVLGTVDKLKGWFKSYDVLASTTAKIERYEDIIFEKEAFIRNLFGHFGMDISQSDTRAIANAVDKRPEVEDVHAHVRQAAPGDHKKKLKAETIARLDDELADILKRFNYN
tara:strand:- start:28649 stop:29458 length:810 start_codon:yes stop_codon:yes gene_type:complete